MTASNHNSTNGAEQANQAIDEQLIAARRRLGVMRGLLFLQLMLLGWLTLAHPDWSPLALEPETSNVLAQATSHLATFVARLVVLFGPLAFLCAASSFGFRPTFSWADVLLAATLGFLVSFTLAIGFKILMDGSQAQIPSIAVIAAVAVVCLAGSWGGATWERSRGVARWCCFQLFSYVCAIAVIGLSLYWFGLESDPLAIDATALDSEDRIRLVKLARQNDPRDLAPGQTSRLTLTERDINQLLTWGLSVVPGEQLARIGIESNRVSFSLTGAFPMLPIDSVLNVVAAGKPITRRGELGFAPQQLRIGRIRVPERLLDLCGPLMIDQNWHNETTRPFFSALEGVRIDDGEVTVAYGRLELPEGFVREAIGGIGGGEDIAPAVRVHTEELLHLASMHRTLTFSQCIETAFRSAKERSAVSDPVDQNRAAILALGYTLGHRHVKQLVGPELPDIPDHSLQKFRAVTLHGRSDWTRHYTLSAALEVLSNQLASRALGLLKEELDADGGSGFSFGDLLADRAGTMLAVSATESEESARIMQLRLANLVSVDDIMPHGSDLPEGLQSKEFARRYGRVDSEKYKRLVAEIDRRIHNCAAYRSLP